MEIPILNALKTEPKADYATLATILDVSPATVKRNIQKLKNIGALKRIGSKKTGYWEVTG
jgi:ATP-dependent DNA helicase RecG